LVQAYCDRNRFFGALFEAEEEKEDAHNTDSTTKAAILDSSEPVEVDAIQYPALFKVAVPVPVKLSRSLLKFGGRVGPDIA
jgi:hypothetical protein